MRGKWSWQMPNLQKVIKAGLFALALSAGVCCIASRALASDSAPDWLRAAAQEKVPEYDKDTNAVILLDETQTTVRDNGEIDTLHRQAVRLLRPEAHKDYRWIELGFDSDTKISYLKAWTIESSGHEIAASPKDLVQRSYLTDMEYADIKMEMLPIPEPDPGNVIGFEYVQRKRPYIFEDDWYFQDRAPVVRARFELHLPQGWEVTTKWFNHAEQEPQNSSGGEYEWEVDNLPKVEVEPDMPPWEAVAGWAGIKYFPRDPAMRSKTNGSWNDMGLWYIALTKDRRVASPQIKQKVSELTSGLTDPLQKMNVLADYMQKNIRYMAISIGIGGYQPHPASEVFAHQFGDCKDKATLLSSMLSEIGIQSYYVMINDQRGTTHPDYPSMSFDHLILAIQLPDNVPDTALYSVVRDPKLGRLLIFDPTNEHVPLGYLPWYLQQNYGLLVAPDGGELIELPLLPATTNRLLRTAKFTLSPGGDLLGDVQEVQWGGPAAQWRQTFLEKEPSKRVEVFEHFLAGSLNDFTLTAASLGNLDTYDQTFSLNYKFVSHSYASTVGDLLFVRPGVVRGVNTGMLRLFTEQKPRKYPVEFQEAGRQDNVFDISLPAGYVVDGLPKPVQVDCDYASYRTEVKAADGALHYHETLEIKDVMVPTEKLPELRAFLQQVAADQESSAVLRKSAQ